MKQPVYLKSFEYSIPAPVKEFKSTGNLYRDYLAMHSPLVKVNIDFENKYLYLEGNGSLLKAVSAKKELTRFDFDKERIRVNANIYCGLDINLSGTSNEALVYVLEGIIADGENENPCSGLLVIDKRNDEYQAGDEWDLRVYLYDSCDEEKEINIDMVISSLSQNAKLN